MIIPQLVLHLLQFAFIKYRTCRTSHDSLFHFLRDKWESKDFNYRSRHFLQILMPVALVCLLWTSLFPLSASAAAFTNHRNLLPLLFYNVIGLVPTTIIYRCLANIEHLPLQTLDPRLLLEAITSPYERKHYYITLLSQHGVATALLSQYVIQLLLLPLLRNFLWSPPYPSTIGKIFAIFGEISRLVLGTALMTPLQLVLTRLLVQKNIGPPTIPLPPPTSESRRSSVILEEEPGSGEHVHDDDVVDDASDSQLDEDPLEVAAHPNSEFPPSYRGVKDCFTTICVEEGWKTLYKGFGLVLLEQWLISYADPRSTSLNS